jgi:protein-disulfide isomerase
MKIKTYRYFALLTIFASASCTSSPSTKAEAPKAAAKAEDLNAPAAKIGSTVITMKELDEKAKTELSQLESAYQERKHQIKEQTLDKMIIDRLVEEKAKAAGKTAEEYVKAEVTDKIAAPSDAEIKSTYEQAKARNPNIPPMAGLKDQIVSFMKQQKVQVAEQEFHKKLMDEAKAEKLLKPYRAAPVEVEAKGNMRGPANAPITIVAFSDYECPYCSVGEKSISEVLAAYPEKVRLFFRDYPLPIHPEAPKAAEAAHCAEDQGKYWQMHDKLFANQKALKIENLKGYAKELGLDVAKFDKCLDAGDKAKVVAEGVEAGKKLGVNGTPAFFVNGILVSGAQPFEAFKKLIDEELAAK